MNPARVTIVNDDTSGISLSKDSLTVREGRTSPYAVWLDSEPTGTVTVTVDVPANAGFTVNPGTLTFTPQSWGTQQVFVRGTLDLDGDDEPPAVITHSISSPDLKYDGAAAGSVTVTVRDISAAQVTVSPTELTINEGGTGTYTVSLDTEPPGDVTVTIGGAGTALTLDSDTLTFTTINWGTAQNVTVTANEDDNAAQDSHTLTHTVSGGGYDGITVDDVVATVTDNDTAGVTIEPTAITVVAGRSNEYTIVLDTEPTGNVVVFAQGYAGTGLDADDPVPVFNDTNWSTPQTVELTALPDAARATVSINHIAANGGYDGVLVDDVMLTLLAAPNGALVQIGVTTSDQDLTVGEGQSETYTVVLGHRPAGDVTVTLGGVSNTDLTLSDSTLTFTQTNWNAAQTVTVTAAHDGDALDDTVTITHTVASADDTAGVTISETSLTILEGNTGTYTVVLRTQPAGNVTVAIGGGGTDVSLDKTTLTFTDQNWSTAQTVTVTATDDAIDEESESFTLTHTVSSTADTDYNGITTGSVTVSITDNDTAGVTINPTTLTVTEGGTNTYTIVLASQPAGDVTVMVNDPTDNTDVTTDPASITFTTTDWNTARTVTVTASQDGDAADEIATITHSVASASDTNYQAISTDDMAVTLEDDAPDTVTVNFKEAAYDADEGASVDVTVTLDNDPERTITVPLTHMGQGGATSADYSRVPGNVTFESGDTEKTFSFAITADDVDDDAESVKLGFVNLPTGVSEGSIDETVVSIIDDDVPSVTVSFEQARYTATEGGTVDVKVKLNADPERTVTILITKTNQDGATSADYSGVPENVVFNSGDTERTITFQATADSVDDDDESVRLTFGTLPDQVSAGTTSDTVVSITDDDVPAVTFNFQQATYTVNEGSSINITATISPDPERTVRIPLSVANQDGATNDDHSLVPGGGGGEAITFNAGNLSRIFSFQADQDTTDDDGESVKISFDALPTGVTAGTTSETVVSITDDDVPSVTVSYEQSTYTVTEGSSVTVKVKVKLNVDPERTVTIPVTKANQSGATSADYSGVPGNVTFNSGDTEKTFSFAAATDSDNDDGESVKLTFGTMPTGVSEGTVNETVVSITDDDDTTPATLISVQVSFGGYAYAVPEGSSVGVTMNLSNDPERTVTIPITITRLGGASDDDYSGVPENVTFNSGVTQTSFTFSATQDSVQDSGESVRLTLGDLPDGVTAGSPAEANFSITEGVGVSFDMATYVATEGGSDATVTVELSNPAPRQVVISLTAEGRNGAIPTDWSGVPEGLTFNAGDTSKTFTFVVVDDFVEDDGEMVELGFGTLPSGFAPGSPSTARVTMMNDNPPLSDPVQTRCPGDSGERIVMVGHGEISQAVESEFWRVELDPGRFYVVEVLGMNDPSDVMGESNPGNLTLSDPHLLAVWSGDGSERMRRVGINSHARLVLERASDPSGFQQFEVQSFGGNTGTYQIKVRVNNICYMNGNKAIYMYAGGPDGYLWDVPADSNTRNTLRPHPLQNIQIHNLLGDNEDWYWESEPDEDWYKIEGVKDDREYTLEVWTPDELPAKHQATRLKILGIFDSNGIEVPVTSISGSEKRVSVTFQPYNTEVFYVSVGSDSSDRTGVYRIRISEV